MLEIDAQALTAIVADVLQCSFGVAVEQKDAGAGEPVGESAMVSITGDWDGAILVGCATSLARQLTAEVVGVTTDEVEDEMLQDTIRELANMIGGRVKCSLPATCKLSLPTAADDPDVVAAVPGTSVKQDLHFSAAQSPMRVTIVERQPTDQAA